METLPISNTNITLLVVSPPMWLTHLIHDWYHSCILHALPIPFTGWKCFLHYEHTSSSYMKSFSLSILYSILFFVFLNVDPAVRHLLKLDTPPFEWSHLLYDGHHPSLWTDLTPVVDDLRTYLMIGTSPIWGAHLLYVDTSQMMDTPPN